MPVEIRQLSFQDFHAGYLQLLGQLTTVGDVSEAEFQERYQELERNPDYYIAVAADDEQKTIAGTATLLVERKFIHQCGKVGHIEDVVVSESCRGQKLGQRLIEHLLAKAQQLGCYKAILDCGEHNQEFYGKCGLTRKEVQMVKYFDR